jgi:hypothetical protein
MFASCGNDKDNKKSDKKNSSDAVTTDAETSEKSDESSKAEENEGENTLTKAFCDSLAAKKFKLTMVTSSDMFDDSTTTVEMNGDNYRLSIGEGDMQTDLYLIDGVMYVLYFSEKTYIKEENPDDMYLNIDPQTYAMGLEDGYVFVSSETTDDGLICETYHAPDLFSGVIPTNEEDGEATVYKYYFKPDGTYPEKVTMSAYDMEQTTTFTDFSLDVEEIKLPDLTGWTDDTEAATSEEGDLEAAIEAENGNAEVESEDDYSFASLE